MDYKAENKMTPSVLTIKTIPFYCNHWPELTVRFNNKNIFCSNISEEQTIKLNIDHCSKNRLEIGLSNKRFGAENVWDTQTDQDGNITDDLKIILVDVLVDDISIIDILLKNMYCVDNTLGQPFNNEKIYSEGTINFNGFFEFEYSLPLLNSIINQKFKIPVNNNVSYFSNYTKTFYYEEDLKIIKEIEKILDEIKKLSS